MSGTQWTAPAGPLLDGASVAQNTFTAAKDIPCGDAVTSFPTILGATLNQGSLISVQGWGVMSNTATPTVILGLYWGGVAGVALAVSTAKTTTTAMANWEFEFRWHGRVVATGTSGSIMGSGAWRLPTSLTAWTEFRWPETAPAAVAIDTTVNKNLTLGVTWSASSASNTVTLHDMEVLISG